MGTHHNRVRGQSGEARVAVRKVCVVCSSSGTIVGGLGTVVRFNPRSNAVGLVYVGSILIALSVPILWLLVFPLDGGGVMPLMCAPLTLLAAYTTQWLIPLRILACPQCRKVKYIGVGRKIPLSWKHYVPFEPGCMVCGYSLIGCTVPRCPECGDPFPENWLAATRLGDPNVNVAFELCGPENERLACPGEGSRCRGRH